MFAVAQVRTVGYPDLISTRSQRNRLLSSYTIASNSVFTTKFRACTDPGAVVADR